MCFVVSICGIGLVTALIGDVASHFGCTLGVKDAVTAICFVALGTSLPGKCELLLCPHVIYVRNCVKTQLMSVVLVCAVLTYSP